MGSNLPSSLRTQGPITSGLRYVRGCLLPRFIDRSRGMGSCVRRNDGWRRYYVYIFASRRHGSLCIGVTNSLSKRMEQHRNGERASFIKTAAVDRVVNVEAFEV